MKVKLIAITVLALFCAKAFSEVRISQDFVKAIAIVESGCNDEAVGTSCGCIGRYQVSQICVDEVNRKFGTSYVLSDMHDPEKAEDVLHKYLAHWGSHYENKTGNAATDEVLARIWNGGPKGYEMESTLPYWEKVKERMDEIEGEKRKSGQGQEG